MAEERLGEGRRECICARRDERARSNGEGIASVTEPTVVWGLDDEVVGGEGGSVEVALIDSELGAAFASTTKSRIDVSRVRSKFGS